VSSLENKFQIEKFEEYFGSADQVQKQMNDCKNCGGKLIFTHLSDFKNLVMEETSRCPECGANQKKIIHIIN